MQTDILSMLSRTSATLLRSSLVLLADVAALLFSENKDFILSKASLCWPMVHRAYNALMAATELAGDIAHSAAYSNKDVSQIHDADTPMQQSDSPIVSTIPL